MAGKLDPEEGAAIMNRAYEQLITPGDNYILFTDIEGSTCPAQ